MTVYFHDRDAPRLPRRIGKNLIFLASLILLPEVLLSFWAISIPSGLGIAWFITLDHKWILTIGLSLLFLGWLLSHFKWIKGIVLFRDDFIEIQGNQLVLMKYDSCIEFFDVPKQPLQLEVSSMIYQSLMIKFNSSEEKKNFESELAKKTILSPPASLQ